MSLRGMNINLFLMEGIPSGRIKCSLANWTGVVYKVPRTEVDRCRGREDFSQSGVYLLFGSSDDSDEPLVYIGQAGIRMHTEGILTRLMEHMRNPAKDYWTEAVVITTSNNSFGQTEISYLENRFFTLASEAGRYTVKNANTPTCGHVTEEKESELEDFIDYTVIAVGALGYKVFEKLTNKAPEAHDAEMLFYLNQRNTVAKGVRTDEGFVVLKGSKINPTITSACPDNTKRSRVQYQSIIDENYILLNDVLLNSPSHAASFVVGRSTNGRDAWKTQSGQTLNEVEIAEIDSLQEQ